MADQAPAALPNPGSDAALGRGCKCPVLDNDHGRGPGPFWISAGCPLHDAPKYWTQEDRENADDE